MGTSQVISSYESLSALTGRMSEAASHGEWDQLIELERQCSRQIALLKTMDTAAALDEPARQRKVQLIKKILEHDADIRKRTTQWMAQLQGIIQSNRQEQRLLQTYGG